MLVGIESKGLISCSTIRAQENMHVLLNYASTTHMTHWMLQNVYMMKKEHILSMRRTLNNEEMYVEEEMGSLTTEFTRMSSLAVSVHI